MAALVETTRFSVAQEDPHPSAFARREYAAVHALITITNEHDALTALAALAHSRGQPVDEVRRSWVTQVRGPWIRSGFFITRE